MRASVRRAEEFDVDMKFCLLFPREALSVPVTRRMLGDALRSLGAEDQGIADLLLAVTEACTNVVRHGGASSGYEVVASLGKAGCRVEVVNRGRTAGSRRLPGARLRGPGWPTAVPVPRTRRGTRTESLSRALRNGGRAAQRAWRGAEDTAQEGPVSNESIAGLPESGRGLAIMRACVDDVTLITRPEQGTVVSLRKRIAWRGDGPLTAEPAPEYADVG